jgi:hypothetical protein
MLCGFKLSANSSRESPDSCIYLDTEGDAVGQECHIYRPDGIKVLFLRAIEMPRSIHKLLYKVCCHK